ncbi:MAG: DNA helicase, partial [Prevotella buccalis]|nr:DNA helicase [Hoylesella buccalis]
LNARVDHLCIQRGLSAADTRAIHQMRRHSNSSSPILPEDLTYDVRALCVFISAVFREAVPSFLVGKIPVRAQQTRQTLRLDERYIRCIVRQWDEHFIWVMPDGETDERLLQVEYTSEEQFADLSYLHDILRKGMPLNLLDCQVRDHLVTPRRIIVIPDYLVDISSLATCFTEYGHHPALFTINRMKDKPNTRHTILGNFAGSALDDIIHARGERAFDMAETLKDNYREKALEYCTCTDLDPVAFKVEAMKQVQNLQQIVTELFKTYNRERALLEPSFVCEQLGIQGRVDMMTTDFRLLVEQKSGKNMNLEYGSHNRHGNQHVEAHYVQALLYYGVLRYNFRLSDKATRIFLLYSKYALPTGLMDVSRLDMLIHEALKLRNLIVAADYTSALEGFEGMLPQLNPQTLNTEKTNTYFYNRFLLPQIEAITVPLEQRSTLEKASFCRMMTFVL